MAVDQFNEPEVLEGLRDIVSQTLSNELDITPGKAKRIASEVAVEFCDLYGGLQVYIAKGLRVQLTARDRKIFSEFDGYNYEELAKKYRVSVRWLYHLVRRIRLDRQRQTDERNAGQGRLIE